MKRGGAIVLLACAAGTACFEKPVAERVDLFLLDDGQAVAVEVSVQGDDELSGPSAPAVRRRLQEVREELLSQTDPWSRRLASIRPASERLTWEEIEGELRYARRLAALHEPEDLERLFLGTALAVSVVRGEDWAELSIHPGIPDRATSPQERRMKAELTTWSRAVAEYLAAMHEVYRHLDENPERARTILGSLMSLESATTEVQDAPDALERGLLARVDAGMERIAEFLVPEAGEAWSVNELAALVYDPFPAPMRIVVSGETLESEGFEPGGDGRWDVPEQDLMTAFRSVGGRWLSPDPLLAQVDADRPGAQPLDLEAFLVEPRRSSPPPSVSAIRQAFESALARAPVYRVRWRRAAAGSRPVAGTLRIDDERLSLRP